MRFNYQCDDCEEIQTVDRSIHVKPPATIACDCGSRADRLWQMPMLNTSKCKDADDIPVEKRVARGLHDMRKTTAAQEERQFQKHIDQRRKDIADGGNRGSMRMTHSVPADLYHGKIRETGDKEYWSDPSNVARHKSCKVD